MTCCLLNSRELQRDVKTLRKVVEQLSAQMDSQAVRERPKIAALLEEVNVIKETMNIQVKQHFCQFFQNLEFTVLICLFEWTPSQRKEIGYPINRDFASFHGLASMVMPPCRSDLSTEQTFLPP